MNSEEKCVLTIYLIDKSTERFIDLENNQVVSKVVDLYNSKVDKSNSEKSHSEARIFREQKVLSSVKNQELKIKIFHANRITKPGWVNWMSTVIEEGQESLRSWNISSSYILFIYASEQGNLFAVTGGLGNILVQKFADNEFGIRVFTHLIGKEDKSLVSLDNIGVLGSIVSSSKIFRIEQAVLDEEGFGKMYKKVISRIETSKLEKLGLSGKLKETTIRGGSSFTLSRSLNVDDFLNVVKSLDKLIKGEPPYSLNHMRHVGVRSESDKILKKKLDEKLTKQLYDYAAKKSDKKFELRHQNVEEFLIASKWVVVKSKRTENLEYLPNFSSLINFLTENMYLRTDSIDNFTRDINVIKLISCNSSGHPISEQGNSVYSQIHGEVDYEDKPFFRLNSKWYQIDESFIETLNKDFKEKIRSRICHPLHISWDDGVHKEEDDYIDSYRNIKDIWVLHKCTPDYIEPCDILILKNGSLFFIHVKRGFDGITRTQTAQVSSATKRFYKDQATGENKYLNDLSKKMHEYDKTRSIKQCLNLLMKSDKHAILAFTDKSRPSRDIIKNIGNFKSNVAKMVTLELYSIMRDYEDKIKFGVQQIEVISSEN